MSAVLLLALAQLAPAARPTVGDTIWIERVVPAGPGWTVRAAAADWTGPVEALGEPRVAPSPEGGWVVRYAAVAWEPGAHDVPLPTLWRLSPDGVPDSLPREMAHVEVASVLPPGAALAPRPPLPPVLRRQRSLLPPVAALGLATGLLGVGIAWRRRRPRGAPASAEGQTAAPVPDERWLGAGEYRAVAARAAAELRGALARAAPDLRESLSVEQLATRLAGRPGAWPVRELTDTLHRLELAAFAAAVGDDVAALAGRARSLAREVQP